MVTAVPTAARSHHAGSARRPRSPGAPPARRRSRGAMRFGFQMNVDSSTAELETAISRPATSPATGPPIARASHHVTRTARDPGQGDQRGRPRAASRRPSGTRPATAGSSRARRGGRRRSTSAGRGAARPRRGPARAGRACRGPGRRPTFRASRDPAGEAARRSRPGRWGPGQAPGPRANVDAVAHSASSSGSLRAAPPGPAAADRHRLRWQVGERPARRDVVGAGHVDRVVALVHPGRLQVVGDMRQSRVAQQVRRAQARRSGPRRGARAGRRATRARTWSRSGGS